MSEPLVPDRPGDLAELGFQPHPTTPLDEIAQMEEEAQASTAAEVAPPEPEAPPPEEPPEAQAQPPDQESAEQVEAATEDLTLQSILAQEQKPVSEESEVTRLRQQVKRYEDLMERQLALQEEQIRSAVPDAPADQPREESGDLLGSAPVQNVLHALREEDPAQYEAALVRIAEEQATRKMEAKYKAIEDRLNQRDEQAKQAQQANSQLQGINNVLSDIKGQGGLEAELIEQLAADPQNSYLGRKFQANPYILLSREGIKGAVSDVAAELRQRHQPQQSGVATVSPSVETSAGGGSASHRGVSLGEKQSEKSPEDQIADDIMDAGGRTRNLEFFGL